MPKFSRILRFSLAIYLLCQSLHLFGQEVEFIQGRLINAQSKIPVPFATIRIQNKAKGVISNADGGFKIPTFFRNMGDTLVLSSIGYESKKIALASLSPDQINIIDLLEKFEVLDEVVLIDSKKVKRRSAEGVVRLAVSKIPQNYPFSPFSYVGYYRDYQLKDRQYLNLNEAILEVLDSGFGTYDVKETNTRIFRYRKNSDFPTDSIAAKPYDYTTQNKVINNATIASQGGNEYLLLRFHDAIRNYDIDTYDFVNRLDKDFVKNHNFKLLPDTFIDNIPLYEIEISRIEENIKVEGKIYIGKGDFKIYKLKYAVFIREQKGSGPDGQVYRSSRKTPLKLLYEITVQYQSLKEKMYLSYISFDNSFKVQMPPKFFPTAAFINQEKERFELVFNNKPKIKDAIKKRNYRIWYQGVRLKLDSIKVESDSAFLFPKKRKSIFDTKRIQSLKKTKNEGITIEVKKVQDVFGNVVHERETASYNQFREFFVQEINPSPKMKTDSSFMVKTRPIFKNQPIATPKNLGDYWMNTPLKINSSQN